jgi:hypothetical protein
MSTYCEPLLPDYSPGLGPPTKRLDLTAMFMAVEETGWQEEEK